MAASGKKGDLEVTILEARNLGAGIKGHHLYCTIELKGTPGGATTKALTAISKESEPRWNQTFPLDLMSLDGEELLIQLFAQRRIQKDKFLGQCQITIQALSLSKEPQWYFLCDKPEEELKQADGLKRSVSMSMMTPGNRSSIKSKKDIYIVSGEISIKLNFIHRLLRAKSRAVISKDSFFRTSPPPEGTPMVRERSQTLAQAPRHLSNSEPFNGTYADKVKPPEGSSRPTLRVSISSRKIAVDDSVLQKVSEQEKQEDEPVDMSANEEIIIDEALKEKQKIVKEKINQQKKLMRVMTSRILVKEKSEGEEAVQDDKKKLEMIQKNMTELEKVLEASGVDSQEGDYRPPSSLTHAASARILRPPNHLGSDAKTHSFVSGSPPSHSPKLGRTEGSPTLTLNDAHGKPNAAQTFHPSTPTVSSRGGFLDVPQQGVVRERSETVARINISTPRADAVPRGAEIAPRADALPRERTESSLMRERAESNIRIGGLTRERAGTIASIDVSSLSEPSRPVEIPMRIEAGTTLSRGSGHELMRKDHSTAAATATLRRPSRSDSDPPRPDPLVLANANPAEEIKFLRIKVKKLENNAENLAAKNADLEREVNRLRIELERYQAEERLREREEKLIEREERLLSMEHEFFVRTKKPQPNGAGGDSGEGEEDFSFFDLPSDAPLDEKQDELKKKLVSLNEDIKKGTVRRNQLKTEAMEKTLKKREQMLRKLNRESQKFESFKMASLTEADIDAYESEMDTSISDEDVFTDDLSADATIRKSPNMRVSFAPPAIPAMDAKYDALVSKLEKLDKLDELLRKLDNIKGIPSNGGEEGRGYAELKAELEQLQAVIFDETGKYSEKEKEDANIKFEKVSQEFQQTDEYKKEVAAALEEKRKLNEPLNRAALERMLRIYNSENMKNDAIIKDKVQKNPELLLIGMDPKAILSKHQNDFAQYMLRNLILDELRAIRASLPKFRNDQKRQLDWMETLEQKIETVFKEPPKKTIAPKGPAVKIKVKPAGGANGDFMAELLARQKKANGDVDPPEEKAEAKPAKPAVSALKLLPRAATPTPPPPPPGFSSAPPPPPPPPRV